MDVVFRVVSLANKAYTLYEKYKCRDDERKSLARFMLHLSRTLRTVQTLPQHAGPIVCELDALVVRAEEKVAKYDARCRATAALLMYFEERKLKRIMDEAQQLLPLLTVSVAAAENVSSAVSKLLRRAGAVDGASTEAAGHLRLVAGAVERLAQRGVTSIEVQQSMTTLREGMLLLHDSSVPLVLEGCADLHVSLSSDVDHTRSMGALRRTAETFSRAVERKVNEMLSQQGDLLAKQDELGSCMRQMQGQLEYLSQVCKLPAAYTKALQSSRNLSALQILNQEDDLSDAHDAHAPSRLWAAAAMKAITAGHLKVTSCLVLGVPLMPEGPLRPVTLPCCGFVVSHAGAHQLLRQRQCHLCHVPLAADAEVVDNSAVALAVAAEERGVSPRLLKSGEVSVREHIGAGSQGTVYRGMWGDTEVAVKKVPLPAAAGAQEMACIKHVIAASQLAAVASPHVCKLHGYCWTDTELWLVLEHCDGTLSELVRRVKDLSQRPGLLPVDAVTLGLMLCCALDGVHRGARYLHLDVKPSNMLVKLPAARHPHPQRGGRTPTSPRGGDAECPAHAGKEAPECRGGNAVSVRLSDFGLAHHLPTAIGSSILSSVTCNANGAAEGGASAGVGGRVAKGTPGYAPPEQLSGQPRRRSDVYGLGATLLFALTGRHPYGRATAHAISFKLACGVPMDVPEYIQPPELRSLLTSMTRLTGSDRPALADVRERLLSIHTSLTAPASTHPTPDGPRSSSPPIQFLSPVHGLRRLPIVSSSNSLAEAPRASPTPPRAPCGYSGSHSRGEWSTMAEEGPEAVTADKISSAAPSDARELMASSVEMQHEDRAVSAPAISAADGEPSPVAQQQCDELQSEMTGSFIAIPFSGVADVFRSVRFGEAADATARLVSHAPEQKPGATVTACVPVAVVQDRSIGGVWPGGQSNSRASGLPAAIVPAVRDVMGHACKGSAGGQVQACSSTAAGRIGARASEEWTDEIMPDWEISADESGSVIASAGTRSQALARSRRGRSPGMTAATRSTSRQGTEVPPSSSHTHGQQARGGGGSPRFVAPKHTRADDRKAAPPVNSVGDRVASLTSRSNDSAAGIRQTMISGVRHHRLKDACVMLAVARDPGQAIDVVRPAHAGAAHDQDRVRTITYEFTPSSGASTDAPPCRNTYVPDDRPRNPPPPPPAAACNLANPAPLTNGKPRLSNERLKRSHQSHTSAAPPRNALDSPPKMPAAVGCQKCRSGHPAGSGQAKDKKPSISTPPAPQQSCSSSGAPPAQFGSALLDGCGAAVGGSLPESTSPSHPHAPFPEPPPPHETASNSLATPATPLATRAAENTPPSPTSPDAAASHILRSSSTPGISIPSPQRRPQHAAARQHARHRSPPHPATGNGSATVLSSEIGSPVTAATTLIPALGLTAGGSCSTEDPPGSLTCRSPSPRIYTGAAGRQGVHACADAQRPVCETSVREVYAQAPTAPSSINAPRDVTSSLLIAQEPKLLPGPLNTGPTVSQAIAAEHSREGRQWSWGSWRRWVRGLGSGKGRRAVPKRQRQHRYGRYEDLAAGGEHGMDQH